VEDKVLQLMADIVQTRALKRIAKAGKKTRR
jgi:hypothetical protein